MKGRPDPSCRDWLVAAAVARLPAAARACGFAVGLAGGRWRPSLARPFHVSWGEGFRLGRAERDRRLAAGDPVPSQSTIAEGYRDLDYQPWRALVAGPGTERRSTSPTLGSPTCQTRQAVTSAG